VPHASLEVPVALRRSEKETVVSEVTDRLKRAEAIVVTDYRGLSVAQFEDLRTKLRASGSEIVDALADLPSREELLATFLGVLTAPQRNLVTVISAPQRNFLNVLNARAAESKAA
jgi:ribosomal protein L10